MTCRRSDCKRAATPTWAFCEAHIAALLRRMGL